MAGKAKPLTTVLKLAVKYGPVAYEAIKHGKEPAKEFAAKQMNKLAARKQGRFMLGLIRSNCLRTNCALGRVLEER